MSDQLTAADAPQTQPGAAWGSAIDDTRKQELWAQLRAWWEEADHGERIGPFVRQRLTGAEVFSLAVCTMTQAKTRTEAEAEQWLRTTQWDDFSPNLSQLCLQGAFLMGAQLQGADLCMAQLQGAALLDAQMQGAILLRAQLQGASLNGAQLQGANLIEARMQGADLRKAQLQGADLHGFHQKLGVASKEKGPYGGEGNFTSPEGA